MSTICKEGVVAGKLNIVVFKDLCELIYEGSSLIWIKSWFEIYLVFDKMSTET